MSKIAESKKNTFDRPWLVFICSAFVLPGLGQIISGFRLKGLIMAGLATVWVSLAGAYFIWRFVQVSRVLAEMGSPSSLAALRDGLAPYAGHFLFSLAVLGCVWLWSAADAFIWSRKRALLLKSSRADSAY